MSNTLPIDRRCPAYPNLTYREIAEELDSNAELSGSALNFVADCIDHPQDITTPKQFAYLVRLYGKHLG